MDGIHDLGGKHGHGKVEREEDEPAFHERWEASVFAMSGAAAASGAFNNADRFRHSIERIDPVAYLSHGYYGRWLGGIETLLVESGLLTVIVNGGVFVREVSRKDAIDVYNVRASLMRLAGETLAERISADQFAVLRDLVERMDAAEAADDFDSFYALNREFHTRIVDYAENDRLRSISDGLVKELHLYRHRSILQGGGLRVSNREHKEILAALEAGDAERAGAAMEDHIKAGKRRFLAATAQDSQSTD